MADLRPGRIARKRIEEIDNFVDIKRITTMPEVYCEDKYKCKVQNIELLSVAFKGRIYTLR